MHIPCLESVWTEPGTCTAVLAARPSHHVEDAWHRVDRTKEEDLEGDNEVVAAERANLAQDNLVGFFRTLLHGFRKLLQGHWQQKLKIVKVTLCKLC